jgi:hypothetical protein
MHRQLGRAQRRAGHRRCLVRQPRRGGGGLCRARRAAVRVVHHRGHRAAPAAHGFGLWRGHRAPAPTAAARAHARVGGAAGYMPVSSITPPTPATRSARRGTRRLPTSSTASWADRLPAAVFVPTAYAELLYGVWLGFKDLQRVAGGPLPQLIACEPAAGAPLRAALSSGRPVVQVEESPTAAYSIVVGCQQLSRRAGRAGERGRCSGLSDHEIGTAQTVLGREGLWAEFSGAAGVAGLRQAADGHALRRPGSLPDDLHGFQGSGLPARNCRPWLPPGKPSSIHYVIPMGWRSNDRLSELAIPYAQRNRHPQPPAISRRRAQHPDAIVFFRLGRLLRDVRRRRATVARELDLVLTSRPQGKNARVPMAGVPHHAAENYIARLIAKGYKVALCEQIEHGR